MSLTMVRARQYNGVCVSRRERSLVLIRMAVFLWDQLVGATQVLEVTNVFAAAGWHPIALLN